MVGNKKFFLILFASLCVFSSAKTFALSLCTNQEISFAKSIPLEGPQDEQSQHESNCAEDVSGEEALPSVGPELITLISSRIHPIEIVNKISADLSVETPPPKI